MISQRPAVIKSIVEQCGYVPTVQADGGVLFKVEGKLFLIPDEDDSSFVRIIHQQFRNVASEAERPALIAAAVAASSATKAAKVYVRPKDVMAATELFCVPVENLAAVLNRSIAVLRYAVKKFESALAGGA